MATEPHSLPEHGGHGPNGSVEMPRPTMAPMVLSLGIALLGVGVVAGPAFLVVGGVVLIVGLSLWVGQMLPGEGHFHEELVEPELRARPVQPVPGAVEHLREGQPGYRFRVPEEVHPISAGVKGGIVGGLIQPIPAVLWGLFSGHGIWYPVNLLAGMVLPGVGNLSVAEMEQFNLSYLVLGLAIHATMSVVLGLMYGVLMPTLPNLPQGLAWGGLMMPLLWTGASFLMLDFINPALARGIDWPWFIVSQFVYGITMPLAVIEGEKLRLRPLAAGVVGGLLGAALMALPAVLWSLRQGTGPWYPVNLLAGTVVRGMGQLSKDDLEQFHLSWFLLASVMHLTLSIGFGVAFALLMPRLRPIPAPFAWGGLLMPLLWTSASYGLMGVVNPVLQGRVSWPWFIVAQFIFGMAAAVVVVRSEKVYIPPAGSGQP